MAYCYKCGKPLSEGDKFCTHCGTEQTYFINGNQKLQKETISKKEEFTIKGIENHRQVNNAETSIFFDYIRRILQAIILILSLGFVVVLIDCFAYGIYIRNNQKENSNTIEVKAICHPMIPYYSIKDNDFEIPGEFVSFRYYRDDSSMGYQDVVEQAKEDVVYSLRGNMIKNMLVYILWISICGILIFLLKFTIPKIENAYKRNKL